MFDERWSVFFVSRVHYESCKINDSTHTKWHSAHIVAYRTSPIVVVFSPVIVIPYASAHVPHAGCVHVSVIICEGCRVVAAATNIPGAWGVASFSKRIRKPLPKTGEPTPAQNAGVGSVWVRHNN